MAIELEPNRIDLIWGSMYGHKSIEACNNEEVTLVRDWLKSDEVTQLHGLVYTAWVKDGHFVPESEADKKWGSGCLRLCILHGPVVPLYIPYVEDLTLKARMEKTFAGQGIVKEIVFKPLSVYNGSSKTRIPILGV